MDWYDWTLFILCSLAAATLLGLLWLMVVEQANSKAVIEQMKANEVLMVSVVNQQAMSMRALEHRLSATVEAVNAIAQSPACPSSLGVRLAKIELLLRPEVSDAAKYRPTGARGGST